jgi:hypothetical protein
VPLGQLLSYARSFLRGLESLQSVVVESVLASSIAIINAITTTSGVSLSTSDLLSGVQKTTTAAAATWNGTVVMTV